MEALTKLDVLSRVCSDERKYGLYISIFDAEEANDIEEIQKACLFLTFKDHGQIMFDGYGYFLFDSKEECEDCFWGCVGDDGPTHLNPYKGPVRVYAITCGPDGQLLNENT